MKKKKTLKVNRKEGYNLDGIPTSNRKMEYYKKIRKQKRLKNNIFKMHFFIKVLSIVFLLWFCSRLMICKYWYLPQNTFEAFPNKHIHIIGNRITPNEKILSALKVHPIPKKPIYLINTSVYEKELQKLSPVKKAFVRRYWLPTRFEVTLEEEIPVITISPSPSAPEIAALTQHGKVISKEYLPIDSKKQKTYKILTYDDFKNWSHEEIVHLHILAQRIEDFSGEKLVYLDIRNKNDVFAQIETTKIRIGELNTTLKERIERLSSIMPQIENLKRQTEYVDIRWDNTTYLKKKSKNSSLDVPSPVPAQNKSENSQESKTQQQTVPVQKTDIQKPKISAQKSQSSTPAPKPQAPAPKPISQPKTQIQELPDINIQIVEP